MNTATLLLLYRQENALKQEDAAVILGCTRANLSKWEKVGIPSRQKKRVMAKIMPSIEAANIRTMKAIVRENPRHAYFISPKGVTLAVSASAARYLKLSQDEAMGRSVFDHPDALSARELYETCAASGLFKGRVLQILVDGIRTNESEKGVSSVAGTIHPVGVEYEGKEGALITLYRSESLQETLTVDIYGWPCG